jgi:hypothetical protein
MKRVILAAAVLALGGAALADPLGPPPAPPVYRCAPLVGALLFPYGGAFLNGYIRGCQAKYNMQMQQWQAQMQYWQAMHQYQRGY